jgi:hypothetical protein
MAPIRRRGRYHRNIVSVGERMERIEKKINHLLYVVMKLKPTEGKLSQKDHDTINSIYDRVITSSRKMSQALPTVPGRSPGAK